MRSNKQNEDLLQRFSGITLRLVKRSADPNSGYRYIDGIEG